MPAWNLKQRTSEKTVTGMEMSGCQTFLVIFVGSGFALPGYGIVAFAFWAYRQGASDAHAFYLYNFVTFILIRPWNIGSPHKRLLGLPLLTNASMWVRNPPTTGAATIKNNHITAPQKNRHARSHRFIGFHNSLPSGSEFPNLERCDENLAGIVARRDCWM